MSQPTFDPWAALAKLQAEPSTSAKAANPADHSPLPGLAVLAGLAGKHPSSLEPEAARRAAFLAAAATEAAEELATPDLDLAYERAEMEAALIAEGRGDFGCIRPDEEHRQSVATLLIVSALRPPA